MSRRPYDLRGPLRRALWVALATTVPVALMAFWLGGTKAAVAALYGGGIAVVNLLLLRWHAGRAERLGATDARRNITIFYRCALERFLAAAVLFASGIGACGLPPLPLLAGFMVAQAAQVSLTLKSKRNRGWRNV